MANVYDERTRERALRHRHFCDPASAHIISELVQLADHLAWKLQVALVQIDGGYGTRDAASPETNPFISKTSLGTFPLPEREGP